MKINKPLSEHIEGGEGILATLQSVMDATIEHDHAPVHIRGLSRTEKEFYDRQKEYLDALHALMLAAKAFRDVQIDLSQRYQVAQLLQPI